MRLIIISGRSGSGKTVALHALEDLGFYCIDNLPIGLLPELERFVGGSHPLVGISIDARNIPSDILQFKDIIQQLKKPGSFTEILYLDADDNTLLKRFSETRRKHPLSNQDVSLREAIRKEQDLLYPIASQADLTLDTTPLGHQELRNLIRDRVTNYIGGSLQLLLESFGYKRGLPPDADFVFDVRCLPNPYWQTELRTLSGKDKPVIDFLMQQPDVKKLSEDIKQFLEKWIPRFAADNRSYLTVALGCTGGQHRSVFLVEYLANQLRDTVKNIQVRHRDVSK